MTITSEVTNIEVSTELNTVEITCTTEINPIGGGGIEEAPIDGKSYARKDADWEEVTGGGSSVHNDLTGRDEPACHPASSINYGDGDVEEVLTEHTRKFTEGFKTNHIEFDNTPDTPTNVGSQYWDTSCKVLSTILGDGVVLQNGLEMYVRVANKTGVKITDGSVVYINGAQGSKPTIALALADSALTSYVIGVATQDISNNQEGFVTVFGTVHNFDTSLMTDGAKLYLSPTVAGTLTETKPVAPHHTVIVGVALNSTQVGAIFINPIDNCGLSELNDVDLTKSKTTPIDADALLLQDSEDSSIWKKLTWANIKTALASTFANLSGATFTGAISATNLSGTNTGDQTTITGNAGTATKLETARKINGVDFDGSADITIAGGMTTTVNTDVLPTTNQSFTLVFGVNNFYKAWLTSGTKTFNLPEPTDTAALNHCYLCYRTGATSAAISVVMPNISGGTATIAVSGTGATVANVDATMMFAAGSTFVIGLTTYTVTSVTNSTTMVVSASGDVAATTFTYKPRLIAKTTPTLNIVSTDYELSYLFEWNGAAWRCSLKFEGV